LADGIDPADVVADWRPADHLADAGLDESGTLLNGRSTHHRVSLVAAYKAVPALVTAKAGTGVIG